MKYIKYYKNFDISEKNINPYNFDEFINKLKTSQFISLEELNDMSKEYDILFMEYDDFYNTLKTDLEKKAAPPKDLFIGYGLKFALYNKYINKFIIVVDVKNFLQNINEKDISEKFFNLLIEILKHESIHKQQVDKYYNNYNLDTSPSYNIKKYFSNSSEIMAYANSFVENMLMNGYTKEDIKKIINNPDKSKDMIFKTYKKLGKETYNKFLKYIYLYLEN